MFHIMALLKVSNVVLVISLSLRCQGQFNNDGLQENGPTEGVWDIVKSHPDLKEFAKLLELEGLHQAFLERQVTLFAPNDAAVRRFSGRRTETLVLNHLANVALSVDELPERVSSLVTGNPPLWVSRGRGGVFVNQARVVRPDVRTRSRRGDEQILHIIDSVLEPLAPISVRDSEYFTRLDAFKLMTKSTLYELSGHRTRVFNQQADLNGRTHMFSVKGTHTFFLPVDSAFDTSVQLSGYDYDRNRLKASTNPGGSRTSVGLATKVRKELVDARVIEGHIIPHRLIFTSMAPTPEFPTVAWLENGIQVNASLQPTSLQGSSADPTIVNNLRGRGRNGGRGGYDDSYGRNSSRPGDRDYDRRFDDDRRGDGRYGDDRRGGDGRFDDRRVSDGRYDGRRGEERYDGRRTGGDDDFGGRYAGQGSGYDRDRDRTSSQRHPLTSSSSFGNDRDRDPFAPNRDGDDADRRAEEHSDLVVVRSNTVVGDRSHARGMVVARIVRGNIPVENGVVHLIDKPLMIVAKSLYEYIMEEGSQRGNRLSRFAALVRDKGGLFTEALLEAKDGTLLAPSDEAFERVDQERLDYLLGSDYLRAEMLGLHFVRERIISTENKIKRGGDETYSSPASLAANRVWFFFNPRQQTMTVEGRGVNASVVEKDIGTVNGVIQVIDRVLGVPYQTVWEKIASDPSLSHTASLLRQFRMDKVFDQDPRRSSRRFTFVVPSNAAWERVQLDFSKAYNTLIKGDFPNYGKAVIERHFKVDDQPLTFEMLEEKSRTSPRRTVQMVGADLTFTQQGEFSLNAYKEQFVAWREANGEEKLTGKILRPNVECTNGIVHVVDKVFLDDAPPWAVGGQGQVAASIAAVLMAVASAILAR